MRIVIPVSREQQLYNIVKDDWQIGRKALFLSFRKYGCIFQVSFGIAPKF